MHHQISPSPDLQAHHREIAGIGIWRHQMLEKNCAVRLQPNVVRQLPETNAAWSTVLTHNQRVPQDGQHKITPPHTASTGQQIPDMKKCRAALRGRYIYVYVSVPCRPFQHDLGFNLAVEQHNLDRAGILDHMYYRTTTMPLGSTSHSGAKANCSCAVRCVTSEPARDWISAQKRRRKNGSLTVWRSASLAGSSVLAFPTLDH